jgi:hypothetical protein
VTQSPADSDSEAADFKSLLIVQILP